jgi:molecular chaperone HtpG
MPEETATHAFEADVSQVLHLVIHSLYSHKEIFLRELVSNASDALDKLRFKALTEDLYEGDTDLAIRIHADREAGTLTIEDNGIGMTEDELVRDLGTVARSGSRAFLEQLAQQGQKDARLIGQFGVGFYSTFLVADRVEVVSRAAGAGQAAHRWVSEGKDTFTMAAADRAARGTAITLHLRSDQKEFLDEWRLRDLVTRYSDYVSHPIRLRVEKPAAKEGETASEASEYETINRGTALWRRPKAEITDDQYAEFYRHLTHASAAGGEGAAVDAPVARTHFKVEGTQEFVGLLYVPRDKPFELRFGMKHRGVRLYVKRVLVMEDCEEIVPEWLRFVVGVIDSDDLPLNVSREVLQQSSAVKTIKKQLVKHVLDALDTLSQEKPDDYQTVWRAFGPMLKQGVATDFESRARLAKLLRYESTAGDGLTSLAEYVKRMKDGQDAIYYAIGETRKAVEGAPHLEGPRKRGFEVLLMTDPIDEFAAESLRSFEGKNLTSVMRADLKLGEGGDEAKKKAEAEVMRPLLDRIRAVLGARVTEVRASERLTDSPCCLAVSGGGPSGYVERLLREAGRDVPKTSRIFELNLEHPIVRGLQALVGKGDAEAARVADWIEILYDQALVAEGAPIDDPSGFARRITSLLSAASQTLGSA